jgi:hypothetical protein
MGFTHTAQEHQIPETLQLEDCEEYGVVGSDIILTLSVSSVL